MSSQVVVALPPVGAGEGARWLGRVVSRMHPPPADMPSARAARSLLHEHPGWTDRVVDLRGLPVLLVGGLASSPSSLALVREWLDRVNARPGVAPIRYGVDCGERTTRQVAIEARRLADRSGQGCVVIGHSRGGQFARAVAIRHPDAVRGLITLGTPVNRLLGVRPLLRAELAVLATIGTLGVPGLGGLSCLWGACCQRLRADLLAPVPGSVSYLSIYSRQDEVVSWRSCLDPWARHQVVTASHRGLLRCPDVLGVLSRELAGLVEGGGGTADEVPGTSAA